MNQPSGAPGALRRCALRAARGRRGRTVPWQRCCDRTSLAREPITLVVPFPPGGATDVLARALAERLQQSLGQPVIVESKPGVGATLGADYVAKARPDGYTLLVGAVHHTIATSVYKKLAYDFQKSFQADSRLKCNAGDLIKFDLVEDLLRRAKAKNLAGVLFIRNSMFRRSWSVNGDRSMPWRHAPGR